MTNSLKNTPNETKDKTGLSKLLFLLLSFTFLFNLISLIVFVFVFRFSINNLLLRYSLENSRVKILGEELKKEIEVYKNLRTANDIKIYQQLLALRSELAKARQEKEEKVLGAKESDSSKSGEILTLLGMVRLKEGRWERIDVFSEPKASSRIIGELIDDGLSPIYFYTQKQPDWFKIEYKDGKFGWVQSQFLEEIK